MGQCHRGVSGKQQIKPGGFPRYARAALKIYSELDPKKYYSVAVLDTEKAASSQAAVLKILWQRKSGLKKRFLLHIWSFASEK